MERIIAENKELEEISEYLKNMYEEEVEENESYIKRIRTEVRRRTERGEEYTIGSGNLFY
jgi:superfamily I DNA and/or RNA helicase